MAVVRAPAGRCGADRQRREEQRIIGRDGTVRSTATAPGAPGGVWCALLSALGGVDVSVHTLSARAPWFAL